MRRNSTTAALAAILFACLLFVPPPLPAQNRAPNPDFDFDVDGWTAVEGDAGWILFDADGCHATAASGGLNLGSAQNGAHQNALTQSQCLAVTPDEGLCFSMRYINGGTNVYVSLKSYLDDQCANTSGGQTNATGAASPAGFNWIFGCTTIAPTVHGARIWVSSTTPNTTTGFTMVADRIYLGPGIPLQLDDFEHDSTCRWSVGP